MDVSKLKGKIKSNNIPSFLIFSGDEWKVQEIYIQQISKVTGKSVVRIDSVSEIYSKLKNRSFLQKPIIYIVRDDKELMQNEKLQVNLEHVLDNNMLICVLTSVDKRTKFYKRYKDTIVMFNALPDAILKRHIQKKISLSDRNCGVLIDICEHDYGRILLEIDKIQKFLESPKYHGTDVLNPDGAFRKLVNDGTIYEPPYDAIFDLVNAILDRKVNNAFDLLEQSYAVGEATMVMLSVLYNNAKALLQIQTYDGNNLSNATGLTPYQIKCVKSHVGKYRDDELNYIVRLISKIERGIKTGRMEDKFAMQYLLTHIM